MHPSATTRAPTLRSKPVLLGATSTTTTTWTTHAALRRQVRHPFQRSRSIDGTWRATKITTTFIIALSATIRGARPPVNAASQPSFSRLSRRSRRISANSSNPSSTFSIMASKRRKRLALPRQCRVAICHLRWRPGVGSSRKIILFQRITGYRITL